MGNSIGGKRRVKVMKIDGSTTKVTPPAVAGMVLRDHPGYVLLESEQVKQLGVRAKALDPGHPLKPGKLYFLVELPTLPADAARGPRPSARRVRSAINMSAKDRLESLMLTRRSVSDISFARVPGDEDGEGDGGGAVRVRMRLPKAVVARLVEESGDPAEVAEKIMELCAGAGGSGDGGARAGPGAGGEPGAGSGAAGQKREKRTRFSLMESQMISEESAGGA